MYAQFQWAPADVSSFQFAASARRDKRMAPTQNFLPARGLSARSHKVKAYRNSAWFVFARAATLLFLVSGLTSPSWAQKRKADASDTGTVAEAQKSEQQEPDLTKLSLGDLTKVQIETVYGASKFSQKVTRAPSSVTIVTADEIQKYGYRTLADLLRSVPGFYLSYDRQDTYIGVRGISRPSDYNTLVLTLIDGHRVNENVYDGTYIDGEFLLDIDLIDRVEIIRGPGSSLYGTDAFFAVINIITKRGRDVHGTEVAVSGGGQETYHGRVSYGQQFKNGLELLLSETFNDSKGNRELFFPEFNSPATNFGIARDADGSRFHNTFVSAAYRDFAFRAVYDSWEKHIPTASYTADCRRQPHEPGDSRGDAETLGDEADIGGRR